MRRRTLLLPVVAVLAWAAVVRAQAVKSPADVFPARVLAYAEIRQPGRLVQEIRSLFQGSVVGHVPESLARLQGRFGPSAFRLLHEQVGVFGLLLSPEVAGEVQRLKGAAIALTGFDKQGRPEFVAVVLPGGSHAPSFLVRTALTMARMRATGKVEGVTLYQSFSTAQVAPRKGEQPRPSEEPRAFGPAVAMMPGALFIGSPEAVKDAIRRARGKGEGDALAQSKAFQEALQEAGKDPGLFAYANVGGLAKLVQGQLRQRHREDFAGFVKLINPRAFPAVVYSATLNKGTFRYRKIALLDPKEKSPILELLPTTPVNTELLHFAPRDALLLAALSNAGGARRWSQLLELADQVAKLSGRNKHLPSDAVKQLEEKLHIDLGKDVMGKISHVVFAVGDPLKAPVKRVVEEGRNFKRVSVGPEVPMVLVVQTADEQAAKKMVAGLARIFGMMTREKDVKPTTREVNGHSIHTLKMGRGGAVHYGRHDNVIVLGPYQAPVAQALAAGADKKGWLANARAAASIKEAKDALAIVALKPLTASMGLFLATGRSSESRAPNPKGAEKSLPPSEKPKPRPKGDEKALPLSEKPKPRPVERKAAAVRVEKVIPSKKEEQFKKEIGKLLALEEPLVITLTRKEDRITAEAKMGGLKPLVARLTDFAIEQMFRSYARSAPRTGTEKGSDRGKRPQATRGEKQ